jgi:hypothetical protein
MAETISRVASWLRFRLCQSGQRRAAIQGKATELAHYQAAYRVSLINRYCLSSSCSRCSGQPGCPDTSRYLVALHCVHLAMSIGVLRHNLASRLELASGLASTVRVDMDHTVSNELRRHDYHPAKPAKSGILYDAV